MRIGRGWRGFLARSFVLGVGALMAAALTPCSSSAASPLKVLYSFCATGVGLYCPDGEEPLAALLQDNSGNVYSTTYEGGAGGAGTVFELTPNKAKTAWTHKVLYRFCAQGGANCTDGAYPYAELLRDASGHLYGTTEGGGAANDGTVFELTPPAAGKTLWTEKVLYSFCQQTDCTDGEYPEAGLIEDAAGNLYGTTYDGGLEDRGVVFELTPPATGKTAWTETVLYSFCTQGDCSDGEDPEARVIRDPLSGNLYGTTVYGGADDEGVVFELAPPTTGQTAWTETVLYSFCQQTDCTDGEAPEARLLRDASGNLYGTTDEGGKYSGGTVYELTPPATGKTAWTETVLHSFCARGGKDCTDGGYPYAGLTRDASGNLYGTAEYGGRYGGGTVFELTPKDDTAWTEEVLYNFCAQGGSDCTDGEAPEAAVTRDASGNLYSTTERGGKYGEGAVFELVKAPQAIASSETVGGR